MQNKGSTSSIIASYRKRRQQTNTLFVYGAAGLLVLAGLIMLVIWLAGPSKPLTSLFATDTPTPTLTFTPSITPPPTDTPTITLTPTETMTATPSAPFTYTVQEGDSLYSIAQKNNLGDNGVLFLLVLNPLIDPCDPILRVGDQILVPNPGLPIPTSTPIPGNLPRGTKVTYLVQAGDNLAAIASKFNSIVDEILKANNLDDPNLIGVGQCLTIPANLVTPTATRPPTSTPRTPGTPLPGATSAPVTPTP